jgi:hypothetical protein
MALRTTPRKTLWLIGRHCLIGLAIIDFTKIPAAFASRRAAWN